MCTEHKIEKHPSHYAPQGNKQLVFTQQVPLYYSLKLYKFILHPLKAVICNKTATCRTRKTTLSSKQITYSDIQLYQEPKLITKWPS